MEKDVKQFVAECSTCLATTPSAPRRGYGRPLRGNARNTIVSADFIFVGESVRGPNTRVLLVSDSFSNFSIGTPVPSEKADVVVDAVRQWGSLFQYPHTLLMDAGPGFDNELVRELAKHNKVQIHIGTPHAKGALGRQERLNKEFNAVLRAVLTEHRVHPNQWEDVLDIVIHALNHRRVASLGHHSPAQLFAGIDPIDPVGNALVERKPPTFTTIDLTSPTIQAGLDNLIEAITNYQTEVAELHNKTVEANVKERSKAWGVKEADFEPGQYVFVKKTKPKKKLKNNPAWQLARIIGPASTDHKQVYKIKYESKVEERRTEDNVHISRLVLFADKTFKRTPELDDFIDYIEHKVYYVEEILDIRDNNGQIELYVKWESSTQNTWEPFATINEDVPQEVSKFLNESKAPKTLISRARQLIASQPKIVDNEDNDDSEEDEESDV
jgi:hypothetical protein